MGYEADRDYGVSYMQSSDTFDGELGREVQPVEKV